MLLEPLAAQGPVWTCMGLPATVVGTASDDILIGTSGTDVIVGREGNDTIDGRGGDDIICAGKGNDTVYGGDGFDVLFGAQGNDELFASSGPSESQRTDSRGARIFGGIGDDRIHGSDRWDRMQGGPGNDQLFGYEGRDWLRAGPGNDLLDGGLGVDDQHGGNGRDDIRTSRDDIVRGGAGLDLCHIVTGGQPALLRSCGSNVRESVSVPPLGPFGVSYLESFPSGEVADWIRAWQGTAEGVLKTWTETVCNRVQLLESRVGVANSLAPSLETMSIAVSSAVDTLGVGDPIPVIEENRLIVFAAHHSCLEEWNELADFPLGSNGRLYLFAFPEGDVADWIKSNQSEEVEELLENWKGLVCAAVAIEPTKNGVVQRLSEGFAIVSAIIKGTPDDGLLETRELSQLLAFGTSDCSEDWDALP